MNSELRKGEKTELFVEKLVFEGAGLARFDGFPVFVDKAAPQEKVLAEIISVNKNFAKAKIVEILEPSKSRVKPFCAMASVCGGCCWQHVDYAEQLRQKKQIVLETLQKFYGKNVEVKDVLPSLQTKEYRHKIQYPISQTKVSKRFLAGYFKPNSHELVNIKHCPIQPEIIDKITEFIRKNAVKCGISAYDEKRHKGLLRHVVFRHSQDNGKVLVIFVVNDDKVSLGLKSLADAVFNEFECVDGALVNYNMRQNNVIMGENTISVVGKSFYTEKLGEKIYRVSAGSFFQVNPKSFENILKTVKKMIDIECPTILDAYSGVGSFGIYLGDIAKSVTCVEDYASATKDAEENVRLNGYDNFEILTGDAKVQLEKLVNAGRKFDVVIVDPPRKGLAPEAVETAYALSRNMIIYVSCNPSTLARDLKLFSEKGAEVEYVQPVDMFCHTFHIENVALIRKH